MIKDLHNPKAGQLIYKVYFSAPYAVLHTTQGKRAVFSGFKYADLLSEVICAQVVKPKREVMLGCPLIEVRKLWRLALDSRGNVIRVNYSSMKATEWFLRDMGITKKGLRINRAFTTLPRALAFVKRLSENSLTPEEWEVVHWLMQHRQDDIDFNVSGLPKCTKFHPLKGSLRKSI